MDYEQVVKSIVESLQESLDETTEKATKLVITKATENTRLFGGNGILDSMGVVILLSDLEEKIEDDFGLVVSLTSDAAMSKTRSPFRSIKSLAEYVYTVANNP